MRNFIQICQLLSTVLFLHLHILSVQAQVEQGPYAKVWLTEGCSGDPRWNTTSTWNYEFNSVQMIWYRVNGLWTIGECDFNGCKYRSIQYSTSGIGCTGLSTNPGFNVFLTFEMFGDKFQNETKLHLFPEPAFQGTPRVISEGGSTGVDFLTKSYFHTGPNIWRLDGRYGGSDDETHICLDYSEAIAEAGYGVTFRTADNFQVKDGIKVDECSEPTRTTRLTTTMTTTPTTTTQAMSTTTTPSTTPSMPPSTTWNPDLMSCINRTDGMYPHPYDCSMFFGCHDEDLTVYECPPPLLFDPLSHGCELPQLVDCDLTCADKPDGKYAHPQDCSLFIICYEGILEVFRCPPPLLFDPELGNCYFPDEVQCQL